jgi:hypothetical protein
MDIVYTYVNPCDEQWAEQFRRLAPHGMTNRESNLRFCDGGELKYSLRSIEKFFQSNGKVVIFTNTDLPEWLNLSHPKLRVVHHSEVIEQKYRPLFHSYAIESFLHKIPDVSQDFLYLNDDFLMTRPMSSKDFVQDGKLIFRGNHRAFRSLADIRRAIIRCVGDEKRKKFEVLGVPPVAFAMTHAGYPVNVELMSEFEEFYAPEIEAVRRLRFRTDASLELINFLYPYFCIDRRRAMLKLTRKHFVRSQREILLQNKKPRFAGNFLRISRELMSRLVIDCPIQYDAEQLPEFACVNEGINSEVSETLLSWFPTPSSFERSSFS